MPESFLGHYIFLATNLAIASLDDSATIEAILLNPFRNMGHAMIFVKNKYKKIQESFCFTLLLKSGNFARINIAPHEKHVRYFLSPDAVCSTSPILLQ